VRDVLAAARCFNSQTDKPKVGREGAAAVAAAAAALAAVVVRVSADNERLRSVCKKRVVKCKEGSQSSSSTPVAAFTAAAVDEEDEEEKEDEEEYEKEERFESPSVQWLIESLDSPAPAA
jgi:hypothetical protein